MSSHEIKNETTTVEIIDLSSTGEGIGRDASGMAFFVPLTLPGDRVAISIKKTFPTFAFAEMTELLSPSPHRAEPLCSLFGVCGGCDWQHIDFSQQASLKARVLTQTLRRIGKIPIEGTIPITAAPHSFDTRTRARFHLTAEGKLGFFPRSSKDAIPVSSCPVLVPSLNAFLDILSQNPFPSFPAFRDLRLLTESDLPQAKVALSLHLAPPSKAHSLPKRGSREPHPSAPIPGLIDTFRRWIQALQAQTASLASAEFWQGSRRLAQIGLDGLFVGDPPVRYHASGFAQASFLMNQHLVAQMLASIRQTEARSILEVYAGSGNLSIPLAVAGFSVLALEIDAAALADAHAAVHFLAPEIQRRIAFTAFHDERHSLVELCQRRGFKPDLLLVDPPRQGLSVPMRRQIRDFPSAWLLYISCEPATFARDLRDLLDAGYEIVDLRALDLIPQTAHIESIALLRLASSPIAP